MYARLQIATWSIALIFGLAYADSDAAPIKTAPAKTPTTTANHESMHQILSDLHQAKHLLDHTHHEYNGHRAKADHEISKAIHILHHDHKHSGTAAKSTAPKTPQTKTNEAQGASDTHLRQAEKLVHAAILGLRDHHGEKAHHAKKLLHEAAHEIELAIHLHHKHHQAKNQAAN